MSATQIRQATRGLVKALSDSMPQSQSNLRLRADAAKVIRSKQAQMHNLAANSLFVGIVTKYLESLEHVAGSRIKCYFLLGF